MDDPVKCWDIIYKTMVIIADDITPEKKYKTKVERPAWLTDELMNLKNDRDYFFKKAKITGEEADCFLARNLRNRVNIAMRASKADYIKLQLNQNRDNPKRFWNLIQTEILPDEKDKVFNFLNEENGELYDRKDLPDHINNFSSEIGPKLASKKVSDDGNIEGEPNQGVFEPRVKSRGRSDSIFMRY